MKRLSTFLLIIALAFALTACGGGGNEKKIVGTWQVVDEETATEYGIGLEFTKDGKLRYGLTEDVLTGLTGGEVSDKDLDQAKEGLEMLMSIDYKIKSDTEMEVTVSAFMGLAKETTTVSYTLDGDSLTFDGATYTRVN